MRISNASKLTLLFAALNLFVMHNNYALMETFENDVGINELMRREVKAVQQEDAELAKERTRTAMSINKSASQPKRTKMITEIGNTTILITGAAGFIGMHTAIELRNRGIKVVAVDNLNDYYSPQLKADRVELLKEAGVSFVKADVCDEAAFGKIIKDYEVERVVHLAAQAGVRFSLKSPHSYISNNVDCFVSVLEQFVKAGLQDKPIVYASSSSVYGFNNDAPFTEGVSDVDHPASLYAATKRADELIAHTYNHLYNVSSVGLRFFTVYGEYGRPDMSPMIFANKIMKGETLKLSNFGNSIRDFTYVSDIVEGIIASLTLETDKTELFNLGGNNSIKLTRFVKLMEQGLKKNATKELVPMQSGDVPLTYANVTRAGLYLNWSPKVPIEVGMKRFMDWFVANDASKYMTKPKKEKKDICVITSSFAEDSSKMDKVWNVTQFYKRDKKIAFYFFSNLDLDNSKKGWKDIKLNLDSYRRMITKSRWPKFMGWKHPVIAQNCKTVFYLDSSSRPEKGLDFVDMLNKLKERVLKPDIGFAIPKHPDCDNIIKEFRRIVSLKKDIKKNAEASLAWFKKQDKDFNKSPMYQNQYFMYDPTSKNWQKLTEYFWSRYSMEEDSWRDQPLLAYCLHYFKFVPLSLKPNLLRFCKDESGHASHTYSEKDDGPQHLISLGKNKASD